MKNFLVLISSCLFSAVVFAKWVPDPPKECEWCESWNEPQPAFHVFGNTWYVGTAGLAAILVVTDAGLILIDGALPQSAPLIKDNIVAAGYDASEIRYILNSHAHFDHAGGIAALQRYSNATVLASPESAPVLQSGEVNPADPQFGFGVEANQFPAVQNVYPIRHGALVSSGGITLTAILTPGHTPGGTTWTWQSCEKDRCLQMVYADSLSAVSAEGFLFSEQQDKNGAAANIRASTQRIRRLRCDILLAPHPFLINMKEKLEQRQLDPSSEPFIDEGACARYADYFDEWLVRRLAEESAQD